jgi:hypothetical protein
MNKKGIARSVLWAVRIGLLLIPMIIFLVIISDRYFGKLAEPGSTEYDLFINRIYKTFAYTSPNTGRSYPNIIDQKKFKAEFLNETMPIQTDIAARISLNNDTIYLNQEFYELGKPLAEIKSDYKEIFHTSPVQILTKDNRIVSGRITIIIVYYKK